MNIIPAEPRRYHLIIVHNEDGTFKTKEVLCFLPSEHNPFNPNWPICIDSYPFNDDYNLYLYDALRDLFLIMTIESEYEDDFEHEPHILIMDKAQLYNIKVNDRARFNELLKLLKEQRELLERLIGGQS